MALPILSDLTRFVGDGFEFILMSDCEATSPSLREGRSLSDGEGADVYACHWKTQAAAPSPATRSSRLTLPEGPEGG